MGHTAVSSYQATALLLMLSGNLLQRYPQPRGWEIHFRDREFGPSGVFRVPSRTVKGLLTRRLIEPLPGPGSLEAYRLTALGKNKATNLAQDRVREAAFDLLAAAQLALKQLDWEQIDASEVHEALTAAVAAAMFREHLEAEA